jgi:hypothetical protein
MLKNGQPTEFSSGERESCSDEHTADTLEAVGERARVSPVPAADVGRVLAVAATAVEDDADDDEHNNDSKLKQRSPEFLFCVSKRSEDVDEDEEQPEDGNPDGDVDTGGAFPILNRDTGGGDLELRRSGAT